MGLRRCGGSSEDRFLRRTDGKWNNGSLATRCKYNQEVLFVDVRTGRSLRSISSLAETGP